MPKFAKINKKALGAHALLKGEANSVEIGVTFQTGLLCDHRATISISPNSPAEFILADPFVFFVFTKLRPFCLCTSQNYADVGPSVVHNFLYHPVFL